MRGRRERRPGNGSLEEASRAGPGIRGLGAADRREGSARRPVRCPLEFERYSLLALAAAAPEAAGVDVVRLLAEQVPADVLVAEDAGRVALLNQVDKVGEAWVELPELDRRQVMGLGPVRPTGVRADDRDKARKVAPVGRGEAVGTEGRQEVDQRRDSPSRGCRRCSPVLDDTNVDGLAAKAWAEPDVVVGRPADLDREVDADALGVGRLLGQPAAHLTQARRRTLGRDRPLGRVLGKLLEAGCGTGGQRIGQGGRRVVDEV